MNAAETETFARRLMTEVWIPFASEAVPRFYHLDVVGHHRQQMLDYDDVVTRLATDHRRYTNQHYDIEDIVAAPGKFAIRFRYTAISNTGQPGDVEVIYFYHLRERKIAEWWLLTDTDFDYRAL